MQLSELLDDETRKALDQYRSAHKPKPRFLRQMASAGVQLVEIYDDIHDLPRIQANSRAHFLPEEQVMISAALDNGVEPVNGVLVLSYAS